VPSAPRERFGVNAGIECGKVLGATVPASRGDGLCGRMPSGAAPRGAFLMLPDHLDLDHLGTCVASPRPGNARPRGGPGAALDAHRRSTSCSSAPGAPCGSPPGGRGDATPPMRPARRTRTRPGAIPETCRPARACTCFAAAGAAGSRLNACERCRVDVRFTLALTSRSNWTTPSCPPRKRADAHPH
jgi:hypothetical protein